MVNKIKNNKNNNSDSKIKSIKTKECQDIKIINEFTNNSEFIYEK